MPIVPAGSRRRSLPTALLVLAFVVSVLATSPAPVAAQPPNYIAGNACANSQTPRWQSGDTWIMYGNVTVPTGCVLTIEPGAFVKADRRVALYVNGQLQANGTASSPISFEGNVSGVPWHGIQFNASSRASYLQQATISLTEAGVAAVKNPLFAGPFIQYNFIDRAFLGILLDGSNATAWGNRVNNTLMGIQALGGGSPLIVSNVVTTVIGNPALGIYATNLDQPDIATNTVRWVNGSNGPNGGLAGQPGKPGGYAVGILVNTTTTPIVAGNTVDQVRGGNGGNGASSPIGSGGAGGDGGTAIGIALALSSTSRVQNSAITGIRGGHGGDGGTGSGAGASGGKGGAGGAAVGLESYNDTAQGWWFYNTLSTIIGGSAGNGAGGSLGAAMGRGGPGGDADGYFLVQSYNANASNDAAQTVWGGYGGNGSVGGNGGQAAGLWLFGVGGSAILGNNTLSSLVGGPGGSGTLAAGLGGNASGVFAFDSGLFNSTLIANNQVSQVTGGTGGLCLLAGGAGGSASGLVVYHVKLTTLSNRIQTVTGGQGGSTAPSSPMGTSGTAAGIAAVLVSPGILSRDQVQSIVHGPPAGAGSPAPPAYGIGYLSIGSTATRVVALLTNTTFTSVGDFDLYVDNYTATTALNVTMNSAKLVVMAAANLTVRNFLAVKAFWPNGVAPVTRVGVSVIDNAVVAYNRTIPSGSVNWIPVTNRVYAGSKVPTWNATQAFVYFGAYTFASNPRTVNLTASQTQTFVMVDSTVPVSSASPLSPWTGTRTFSVHYTYSDGNGTGVKNITLWYSLNGTAWVRYAVQNATSTGLGAFPFTAPADGNYQFATTAYDAAGNHQPFPPTANNTWTNVDTRVPSSRVAGLTTWQRSLAFTVSWGPAAGETDIAFYEVDYEHGASWVTWFGDTAATSATFDIVALGITPTQGVYAFRTIAHSFAGLVETKTANDTWTVVDTLAPASAVSPLGPYTTAGTFAVTWSPSGGTPDIANYTVQVSADGGSWATWFSGAVNRSASFTGRDGHRYAFRSLATDFAGNVETKSGNDTWVLVDLTAPASLVAALPAFESVQAFGILWAPATGTTDAASFALQVSADGGSWTTWFSGATNRSATFAGRDGHRYAFRSLATDFAGNVETKSGNDTWTVVDTTAPYVSSVAPEGSGVNTTPSVTIAFSEAMDQASVVQAFTISPVINGLFTWSAGGSLVTFTPSRALEPGTVYVINLDTRAKDLAGNPLASPRSFTFTTLGTPPGTGGALGIDPLWLALIAVVIVGVAAAFLLLRRRSTGGGKAATEAPKSPAAAGTDHTAIDDVFLLYRRDGILVKHETRRLRPDIDTDILSGMLTAVQQFVKDSFRGDEGEELNEMTVGQMHILIGRGKWLILAATITGGDMESMTSQIGKCVQDMEDHNWDRLDEWDGDMELAKALTPYLKKLIRGEYA